MRSCRAFARFALTAPLLRAFDKERAAGNFATLYGIERVPCDTHMREILDPVCPEALRPVFKRVCPQGQRGKARESMAFLDGHSFLARDGTGDCSSTTMHGASCLPKVHRHGSVTYSQQMSGAAIGHPDVRAVMPLMPDALVPHDGTANNAGERHAAQRFGAQLRQDHPHLTFLIPEDSLRANAPHRATRHDHALHSILGVTANDHALLCNQGLAAEHAGRVTDEERHDRAAGRVHRFRFVKHVPLNASHADGPVNVIEYWERGADRVHHLRGGTDWRVNQRTVHALRRGGRARWKIANETCNTLKNQGENYEHHEGHGMHNLAVVFATVMLLAFLGEQPPQLCWALVQAVWAQLGRKRLGWERRRALGYPYPRASMRALFEALFDGLETSRPLWSLDASDTPPVS